MPKKWPSLKNRGLIPTIQPDPDFSLTCGFCLVLDNVELFMYMKFQKFLMTRWRDMDKEHQKWPKNGVFPPFVTPHIFFRKSGSVTFVPLWYLNLMQNKTSIQWTPSVSKCNPLKTEGSSGKIRLWSPNRSPNCFFVF